MGEKLQFEPKNLMHEVNYRLSQEEDVTNEIPKDSHDFKKVYIEEQAEGESTSDGEIRRMTNEIRPRGGGNTQACCDQDKSEVMNVANAPEGVHTDKMEYETNICTTLKIEENKLEGCVSDNVEEADKTVDRAAVGMELNEEGICSNQEAIKHKNVIGDEEEVAHLTENLETIQEDEAMGGGRWSRRSSQNISTSNWLKSKNIGIGLARESYEVSCKLKGTMMKKSLVEKKKMPTWLIQQQKTGQYLKKN